MTWTILPSQRFGEGEFEPQRDPDWAGHVICSEAITSTYSLFFKSSFVSIFFSCTSTCNVVNVTVSELDSPFSRWSKEQVCVWLQNQGLDLYVNQAQQCISSGQTLLKASPHDLEKVTFSNMHAHTFIS